MGNRVGFGEVIDAKIQESKPLCSLGKFYISMTTFCRQNYIPMAEFKTVLIVGRRSFCY